MNTTQKTLIIAYGNRDRQDDGAGWHILADCAASFNLTAPEFPGDWVEVSDASLRLWYLYQLMPELSEDLIAYQRVIFIDAHNSPELPGLVFEKTEAAWVHSAFTHHMSIGELLSITRSLFGVCPEAWLLSVRGYAFEFSRKLSAQTEELTKNAARLLQAFLRGEYPACADSQEGAAHND